MTKAEYHTYLASREWAVLKTRVRERSGGRCERCHDGPHDQTHHLTYERIGTERLEDLLGVCEPCHLFLSGKQDSDPAAPGFASGLRDYLEPLDHTGDMMCCPCGEAITGEPADFVLQNYGVKITATCAAGHRPTLSIAHIGEFLVFTIRTKRRTLGEARAELNG